MKAPAEITVARNLVRPFFNLRQTNRFARKPKASWANIQRIRALANSVTAEELAKLVENKPHFPFPGLGNTFPTEPKEMPLLGFRRFEPLSERNELHLQLARIELHKDRLEEALNTLSQINRCCADGVWTPRLDELIDGMIAYSGYSFTILRKMLFVSVVRDGLAGLSQAVRAITDAHPARVWGIYAHFLYDMVDPTFEPSASIRHWSRIFSSAGNSDRWYTSLFLEQFLVTPRSSAERTEILLRLSTISLLDTIIFIWRNGYREDQPWNWAVERLPASLVQCLRNHFTDIDVRPPKIYAAEPGEIADSEVFRLSQIFADVASVASWRTSWSQLIIPHLRDDRQDNGWFDQVSICVSGPDAAPAKVADTAKMQLPWQSSWLAADTVISNQSLMMSTLLGEALRSNSQALQRDRLALAEAISIASGIHEFVDAGVFEAMISAEEADPDVLDFVLRDLVFRQFRSRDNDLERRLALMRLVKQTESQDLPKYIRDLAETHPKVAEQIARTCSRLFIEKLFLLMANLKEVIEARIAICEWQISAEVMGYELLGEEVSALRQELANLDTRSDLDSTRIHVDEDSLRDWYNETQQSAVFRYVQTVLAEGSARPNVSLMRFLAQKEREEAPDEIKVEAQVGSEYLLLGIFDKTLQAFVRDRSFGLDAYLSRRIRHGTLSGYIMTPLVRATKRIDESDMSAHILTEDGLRTFSDAANSWRKQVGIELDDARKHVIQLHSGDQPRGLIRAEWRTAANIQHLDAALARIRSRVIDTKGAYDVFADLYALCWACVESDLAQLRRYLIRNMYPRLQAELADVWNSLDSRGQAVVSGNVQELHVSLRTKLQEVCGWFIRPVFRKDSYSLKMLVSSTISIVRELDDAYTFTDLVDVSDAITLNRASFDVFGDLLFVILGNAAKYGLPDGTVRVSAENGSIDEPIMVEIQSFMSSLEAHRIAVARIQSAMNSQGEDLEQAAIEEGFSGLRKAVGIINHIRSGQALLVFYADEEILDIRFLIYLPSEIAANRGG